MVSLPSLQLPDAADAHTRADARRYGRRVVCCGKLLHTWLQELGRLLFTLTSFLSGGGGTERGRDDSIVCLTFSLRNNAPTET